MFRVLILLFIISSTAQAIYSKAYDDKLDLLTASNPNKSLSLAKQALQGAQAKQDIKQQLIALFYITESYSILANYEKVDFYLEKGLSLATKYNNLRFMSEFIGYKAFQQELTGDYISANLNSNKALQLARELDDLRLVANQTSLRGSVHIAMENYDLAIKDIQASIEIFKLHKDYDHLSLAYNSLAIVHFYLKDYDNAIKFYQESDEYDQQKSPYNQAIILYNIGVVYAAKKDYPLAVEYYKKSTELSSKTGDKYTKALTNFRIAEVLMIEDKTDQAEVLLLPMFEIFEFNKDILMIFNGNLLMAEIKIANQFYSQALMYLNLAQENVKKINTPSTRLKYLDMKIQFFTAQSMWQQAFELKDKASLLKSEFQEKNKDKLVEELKVRFNAKFDQEKLELLLTQNKLQEDVINQGKSKQKYLWGLILLSLIILGITYFGYISQRKIKRHLYKLSITDYLTKVANRRQIIHRLKELHLQSATEDLSFGLVMIDLDYFKSINDTYGHDIGNEVLIYFAKIAQRIFSDVGEVGRIGGEEWLILLPNMTAADIQEKLQELRASYKDAVWLKIPQECDLSFSSGVIIYSGQYATHEIMLREVDLAMYRAKRNGREQDVFI